MPLKIENSLQTGASYPVNEHFIPMPLCFQETEYTCGVACVQSLLASYGIYYKQDVLATMLNSKPYFGTDYERIIWFLEMLGFEAMLAMDLKIKQVQELIDRKIPPILLLQAWKEDSIDYSIVWRDSHYVIANGYNEECIYFMDPYTLGNFTYIPNDELEKRWHFTDKNGRHYYNCALIIKNSNCTMNYDPHQIKHQE